MEYVENSNKPSIVNWLLLAALAIIPPLFGTAFTRIDWLKSSTLLIITGLAAIAWAISVFRGKKTDWKNAKSGALILGFGIFAILSLIWAPNAGFGLENAMLWLMFAVLSFLFATNKTKVLSKNAPVAIAIGVIVSGGMCFADLLGVSVFSKIWDAPGAAGAFDSVNQAGTYFFLAISVLLISVQNAEGWRKIFTIVGVIIGALAFGSIASLSIIHVVLFIALVISIWFTNKQFAILILSSVVVGCIAIGNLSFPRADTSATISNKLPVVYDSGVLVISDIKSSKIQNTGFDINRIEDAEFGSTFTTLTNDLFSRDFSSILIGKGAGSWWLVQNPDLPKKEFRYYSIHRDSPALPLFELGLLGILFLIGFVATVLLSKNKNGKFRHIGIPLLLMIVLGGLFSTLATTLLILAYAIGMYAADDDTEPDFVFNAEGTKGLSTLIAVTILISGLSFVGFGAFSGIARFKESRGDLLTLRKKYSSAAKAYEDAYAFSKLDPSVAYNYALVLRKIGRQEVAAEPANTALSIKPKDARFLYLVSQLQLSKQNVDDKGNKEKFRFITEAAGSVEKAIALFPNYIEAIKSLVLIQDLQGRKATANQTLVKLVKLDPPPAAKRQAHSELGQSFTILGKPQSALEHYQKALIGEVDQRQKQSLSIRINQIKAKIQEERFRREGKAIPEALKKTLEPDDHSNHGH